jgi:hypothetical protein
MPASHTRPERVGGFLLKPVELLENEFISRSDFTYHWRSRWTFSMGKLFLTNLRIIYSGGPQIVVGLLPILWPREWLTLDLDDIEFVGQVEQGWLGRSIAGEAFFIDVCGQRHRFGLALGQHLSWLQELERPLPSKDRDDED